jgi:hypothetical protein
LLAGPNWWHQIEWSSDQDDKDIYPGATPDGVDRDADWQDKYEAVVTPELLLCWEITYDVKNEVSVA